MTTVTLAVPPEYGYVVLAATLSTFVGQWHNVFVGSKRRVAKVPYPNCYATAAEAKEDKAKYIFNCAQRAHSNFLEHQSGFLVSLLIAGLKYPTVSAGLGVVWSFGRVVYAIGYTNPNKQNGSGRMVGNFFWLPEFGLQLIAGWTGVQLLLG